MFRLTIPVVGIVVFKLVHVQTACSLCGDDVCCPLKICDASSQQMSQILVNKNMTNE